MAKRENRIAPIQHEIRQLTNLKTLLPNTTLLEAQPYSDCLVDIAIAALEEAVVLESGQPVGLKRIGRLMELVDQIATLARTESGSAGE